MITVVDITFVGLVRINIHVQARQGIDFLACNDVHASWCVFGVLAAWFNFCTVIADMYQALWRSSWRSSGEYFRMGILKPYCQAYAW